MHQKYSALFTSVNLLLGVGPLILPMPFFNAGIILSVIWLVLITILSYNSAQFISESMSKLHQIQYNRKSGLTVSDSLISSEEAAQEARDCSQQVQPSTESKTQQIQQQRQYDHSTQLKLLYGDKWQHFPSIAIVVYLTGTSISKCIMTGKTLEKVFKDINAGQIFESFNFWLFIFFVCGAVFSFRSIDKTKVMQAIIIGVRFISILLFIGGAIFLIAKEGVKDLQPPNEGLFNLSNFVEIFSNSVFSFMFHHSLPSIVNNLRTTEDVTFVIKYGFLISGLILLIIPMTGSMAFGKDLGTGQKLIYYNFDFENKIAATYWVTSFYVFLNIAAFSVYIIVIRTYILKMINPKIDAKSLSRQTLLSSAIILAIVLLSSWLLQQKIQIVLDFTGGIFGVVILFLIPSMEVWKARQIIYRRGTPKNYINWLPLLVGFLGFLFMGFNLWNIIQKLI